MGIRIYRGFKQRNEYIVQDILERCHNTHVLVNVVQAWELVSRQTENKENIAQLAVMLQTHGDKKKHIHSWKDMEHTSIKEMANLN